MGHSVRIKFVNNYIMKYPSILSAILQSSNTIPCVYIYIYIYIHTHTHTDIWVSYIYIYILNKITKHCTSFWLLMAYIIKICGSPVLKYFNILKKKVHPLLLVVLSFTVIFYSDEVWKSLEGRGCIYKLIEFIVSH